MKLLAASLVSILTVLLLNLIIVLVPAFMDETPINLSLVLYIIYFVSVITAIITAFVGIPIYVLLKRLGKSTKINLALIGFIIPKFKAIVIAAFFIPSDEYTNWEGVSILKEGVIAGMTYAVAAVIFGFVVEYSE